MNIPSVRDWRFYTAGSIFLALLLVFQLVIELGGTSHGESNCFLLLYNFTPDLLKTVFDPLRTDWNLYQSRELSYFIDALDARFIGWCIKHQMAHFYSLSAIISAVLILAVQQWGFAKGFPKLNCWAGVMLSAVWLWTPCNFEHHFFRSGKPLTALGITTLLFSAKVLFTNSEKKSRVTAWVLAVIAVLFTPMVDRQGLFLVAASGVFFALAALLNSSDDSKRISRQLSVVCVSSVALQTLVNTLITPAIINALNGYTPSFGYQSMPFLAVFDFSGLIYFLIVNIGFWFTGFDSAGIIIVLLFAVVVWRICRDKMYGTALTGVYAFAVLAAMANLMMFRHRLLILEGVTHSTYFMPFAAVTVFVMAIFAECFEWKKSIAVLSVIGAAVIASQMVFTVFDDSDPVHNRFHRHATPYIIKCLNDSNIDHRQIPMPYSSWKLIDAFRGKLNGWELGGCPIKFPKR